MIGANQFGSVQLGSVQNQALSGYLYTAFETVTIDDTRLMALDRVVEETILIEDSVLRAFARIVNEELVMCANSLKLDPSEGTQVGLWRRTPKTKTIWTKPCE